MRLFEITKTGTIALALAVLALWTCFASEKITTQHARNELRASLRKIRLLRDKARPGIKPVSLPAHSRPASA